MGLLRASSVSKQPMLMLDLQPSCSIVLRAVHSHEHHTWLWAVFWVTQCLSGCFWCFLPALTWTCPFSAGWFLQIMFLSSANEPVLNQSSGFWALTLRLLAPTFHSRVRCETPRDSPFSWTIRHYPECPIPPCLALFFPWKVQERLSQEAFYLIRIFRKSVR